MSETQLRTYTVIAIGPIILAVWGLVNLWA